MTGTLARLFWLWWVGGWWTPCFVWLFWPRHLLSSWKARSMSSSAWLFFLTFLPVLMNVAACALNSESHPCRDFMYRNAASFWGYAAACRELNAWADEAALSVTGHFKDAFDAALAKHSEAVAWSIHAFHCQVAKTKRSWNALLDLRAWCPPFSDLWRLNYFTLVRSRLTSDIINNNNNNRQQPTKSNNNQQPTTTTDNRQQTTTDNNNNNINNNNNQQQPTTTTTNNNQQQQQQQTTTTAAATTTTATTTTTTNNHNQQQPTTDNWQLTIDNRQPTTNNQQPPTTTNNHQQPTTTDNNRQQPTTTDNNQQPATSNQQPATDDNQPPPPPATATTTTTTTTTTVQLLVEILVRSPSGLGCASAVPVFWKTTCPNPPSDLKKNTPSAWKPWKAELPSSENIKTQACRIWGASRSRKRTCF